MNKPKDPNSTGSDQTQTEPTAVGEKGGDKRSGRVAYDSRGNPIWEWQLETGVYTRDMTTQRLRKLDLGELSLAETAKHPQLDPKQAEEAQRPALPGGGFNPYDNSTAPGSGGKSGGFNPYDNARAVGSKIRPPAGPTTAPTPPAPRKPVDLRKLGEWMKIKKRTEENKDDE
ncbi:hypothetical protein [Povalibacter sp.]|uniref:hypothetical protein n=1 Tax=Povalibacter sp. TaxID=1962978 RepID=UPI002F3E322E